MAPRAVLFKIATCISCPPIYCSNNSSSYFLKRSLVEFLSSKKFFIILTPKLEPSLIGLTTIGNFNLFLINFFLRTFFLISFFF